MKIRDKMKGDERMEYNPMLKEFEIHDIDGYDRLMKSLDEAEQRPRKRYEKPEALVRGEELLKKFSFR